MKISDFFKNEYVNHASYDNLRKIASLVDGQKNAARKILYTILEKNIREKVKVSQLGAKCSEFAEYLHGSMDGVIVNLAQDFPGTNNITLLQKKGNFGTRFSQDASAARYIYSHGTDDFFNLFKKDDIPILKQQNFEGSPIEPLFYVPSLPILLVNGSEGVSSGFAQKILSRNPESIKQYIVTKLKGGTPRVKLVPWFRGFNGIVEQGENGSQWLIKGVIERTSFNKVTVKEVPIGYDLKGYLDVLDKLEENKIIQGYRDKSEDDQFLFEVSINSKTLKEWSDDEILEKLKLIKKITENYTVIDENNKILVYNSAEEILDHYIRIKLEYLQKRKAYQIQKYDEDIRLDFSKYLFIKLIVENKLKINKRKKCDIESDLEKQNNIIKKNDSYDYLLNMNILSLTEERMVKLEQDIKVKKQELEKLNKKTINTIWMEEL